MFHSEKRKKKKEKRSKHKKHEKEKKCSSSEKSSSSGDEWVESLPTSGGNTKRDEWMETNDFVPTFSNNELKSAKRKEKKEEERRLNTLDKPGQHERELNPYWKDGGRGLPTTKEETSKDVSYKPVGDGGVDWLRRGYRRVMDQAKEEKRSPEEVAAERWGSLDRLKAMLQEAEEKAGLTDRRGGERYKSSSFQSSRHGSRPERTFHKPRDDDRTFQRPRDDGRTFQRPREEEQSFRRPREEEQSFRRPGTEQRTFQKPREESSNVYSKGSSYSSRDRPRWQKANFAPPLESNSVKSAERNEGSLSSESGNSDSILDKQEDTSEKESRRQPIPQTLTKKEMNELGAKIVKAELLGNTELAEKLKAQLNAAKEASVDDINVSSTKKQEVVLLTQSNSRGLVSPLVCGSTSSSTPAHGSRKKLNKLETHRDGERVCYFQDDSKYSLQQMFQREKFTTADDETAMYLKLAGGKSRLKTDDDFVIDDALLSRQERCETEERLAEKQKNRAIHEHKKMSKITENCSFCLDSAQMQKHLIVALGTKAYISLPSSKSLEIDHCYIVPMTHVPATTHLDEDVWEEVQLFRRTLTEMFKSQEKDVVFMETSLHLRRHPHTFIECVPLSLDLGSLAPMYFKKAILECDTEWAQNKRLVDLSKKNIRHSVPKGLPYFAVDFGLDGGFAHVVEDEQLFPDYFGREILGGMLDLEPRMWQKPQKENFKDQSQKVLNFEKCWKPFDCTAK